MFAKTFFLSEYCCWDSTLSLLELDQKLEFDGNTGFGDSYLDYIFCRSKVFRLNALLHDAAGAVRAHSGKSSGYCYMIGKWPNSCFRNHVTGLFFYVKLFVPSIFNFVGCWSSMSCIRLDVALADKNFMKELGVFTDENAECNVKLFCNWIMHRLNCKICIVKCIVIIYKFKAF